MNTCVEVVAAETYSILKQRIEQKSITVGVIGLGYVGLPFLVEKAKVGLNVIGFDRNQARVDQLLQKQSYIDDVSDADLEQAFKASSVRITTDVSLMREADVLVICVPTPLDKNDCPNLQYVESVCEQIRDYLRPGHLVSLESTTYPGTTQEVMQPILEQSGLRVGIDFFLAHSPERVDPGNQRYTTKNTNKVVGADDEKSLALAVSFYQLAIETVVPVSSTKIAELVKVYENTFRAVNIALANQMALLCHKMDIDVWETLDAAFTKPFGIMPFYPGPGVGGHCIPIDPHYLEWKAKEYGFNTRLINLAGEINRSMPRFVVERVQGLLNKQHKALNGAKCLIVGVAYKADLADYRESPAMEIMTLLQAAGVTLAYHDLYVPEVEVCGQALCSQSLSQAHIEEQDCVLILAKHSNVDFDLIVQHAKQVFDTRNVFDHESNVEKL
jgi:UDP-N-acetyl-D-glucosamine dehydrogenase